MRLLRPRRTVSRKVGASIAALTFLSIMLASAIIAMFLGLVDRQAAMTQSVRENALWAAYQADREASQLRESLARHDLAGAELHYDILYSRVALIGSGQYAVSFNTESEVGAEGADAGDGGARHGAGHGLPARQSQRICRAATDALRGRLGGQRRRIGPDHRCQCRHRRRKSRGAGQGPADLLGARHFGERAHGGAVADGRHADLPDHPDLPGRARTGTAEQEEPADRRGGAGGQPGQVDLPCHHEPRNPHPAQRHRGDGGADVEHRPQLRAAPAPARHQVVGRAAARRHFRRAGLFQARGDRHPDRARGACAAGAGTRPSST